MKIFHYIAASSNVAVQYRDTLIHRAFYLCRTLTNIELNTFYNWLGKINNSPLLSALQASIIFTIPIVLIGSIVNFIRGNVLLIISEHLPSDIVVNLSDLSNVIVVSTYGFSTILFISVFSYRYVLIKSTSHNFTTISPRGAAAVSALGFLILASDTDTATLLDKISISHSLALATVSMITSTFSYLFLSDIKLTTMRRTSLSAILLFDRPISRPLFAFTGTLLLFCIVKYFTLYFNVEDLLVEFNTLIGFESGVTKSNASDPYNLGFVSGTLGVILAFVLFTRTIANRKIIISTFFAGVFFLNEPILFGLHFAFFPILFIPFLLCCLFINSGLPLEFIELKSNNYFSVISSYLNTNTDDMSFVLTQIHWLLLWFCVYAPFVKLCEFTSLSSTVQSIRKLGKLSEATANPDAKLNLLHLATTEGNVARVLAHDLRASIKKSQDIYLLFQPQINTKQLELMGVEALLRWRHPIFGAIPTPLTIQLAEEFNLIKELGEFVLFRACQARNEWSSIVGSDFTMSVNISPNHLVTDGFDEIVLTTLDRYRLEPKCLELEITENAGLTLDAATIAAVHRLRDEGVRIALDDYGMGHTSLRYLQNLPIDTVKIDRSLTADIKSTETTEILKSIKQLSDAMTFDVIIEGVETEGQLIKLEDLGFQRFQGYFFSKPLTELLFFTHLTKRSFIKPDLKALDRTALGKSSLMA